MTEEALLRHYYIILAGDYLGRLIDVLILLMILKAKK